MTTTITDILPKGIKDRWPNTPEEQHQFLARYGSYLGLQSGIEDRQPTWEELKSIAIDDPFFGDRVDNWSMQEALDYGISASDFEPIFRSSANVSALHEKVGTYRTEQYVEASMQAYRETFDYQSQSSTQMVDPNDVREVVSQKIDIEEMVSSLRPGSPAIPPHAYEYIRLANEGRSSGRYQEIRMDELQKNAAQQIYAVKAVDRTVIQQASLKEMSTSQVVGIVEAGPTVQYLISQGVYETAVSDYLEEISEAYEQIAEQVLPNHPLMPERYLYLEALQAGGMSFDHEAFEPSDIYYEIDKFPKEFIDNENTFLEGAKKLGEPLSAVREAILDSPQSRHLRNLGFSEVDISDYANGVQQRHVSNVRQYVQELQSSIGDSPAHEVEADDFERD